MLFQKQLWKCNKPSTQTLTYEAFDIESLKLQKAFLLPVHTNKICIMLYFFSYSLNVKFCSTTIPNYFSQSNPISLFSDYALKFFISVGIALSLV